MIYFSRDIFLTWYIHKWDISHSSGFSFHGEGREGERGIERVWNLVPRRGGRRRERDRERESILVPRRGGRRRERDREIEWILVPRRGGEGERGLEREWILVGRGGEGDRGLEREREWEWERSREQNAYSSEQHYSIKWFPGVILGIPGIENSPWKKIYRSRGTKPRDSSRGARPPRPLYPVYENVRRTFHPSCTTYSVRRTVYGVQCTIYYIYIQSI